MDTGVTGSGGIRNRVQHHVATLRLAGAQQRRRRASRGITKCPVGDAMEAVLADASTPRLPSSSTLLSPSAMIPSMECRSRLITPSSAPSSSLLRTSPRRPFPRRLHEIRFDGSPLLLAKSDLSESAWGGRFDKHLWRSGTKETSVYYPCFV